MKYYKSVLPLVILVVGLITVILGVFILRSQTLIVSGCLLTAAGAGWNYRIRNKDNRTNHSSE